MSDIWKEDSEKARQIRDVICGMLDCGNSGLSPETVRICIELMRHGVQPKQLAEIVRTLKQEVRVMKIESGLVKTMENMKMKSDFYTITSQGLSSDTAITKELKGDSKMKKELSSSVSIKAAIPSKGKEHNLNAIVNQELMPESIRNPENESILKQITNPILKCAIKKILNEMID
ncbi:uncharacterized protein LOC121404499 [Drosophila obscura]|uniref:uncharacterized protein LOC121404499 n=1 Tax=Drosophila obscura TaxID=7282 RepID=UPI001BB23F47|nr:uncharacterized protein LOC121404499 [Drosophila obscura]